MTHNWSDPEIEIFDRIRTVEKGTGVLATIVDVEGNAYRRPGAKMVIDGEKGVGSITAGCLEDEVLRLAGSVLEDGTPRIETFDLMEDDDVWGLGMGCHGIIDVLLEPIDGSFRPAVDAYHAGERVAVLTVLESSIDDLSPFARAFYRADGGFDGSDPVTSGNDEVRSVLESPAEIHAKKGNSQTVTVETDDGTATVFIDGIEPSPDLVVIGTGPDVDPIVELGMRNEFRVTVIGFRGGRTDPERFPAASEVHSTSPHSIRSRHDFDPDTYVVVMTHNYVDDRLTVEELLETPVPYVALVGAHERFERMLADIREERGSIDRSKLGRLYSPAGLDLGGGSPNQIATSIVAELLAVRNERTPRHLREREGPIHERIEEPETDG